MDKRPGISAAEWTVMQVLWRESPLSVLEVFEALQGRSEWHPKTIRTLIGRLLAKGIVAREKRAGVYRFSPRYTEVECVREESQSFLERCFAGKAQPMLAHFIEHENLTQEDVASLRAMLDAKIRREHDDDSR
ncbi:MAG: BlaI/MecI/CopY family transcriptional regulator [Candidatus Hydrogenedentes bacterium]|nr:BlaI/MecI/CopY family transcriptional regulator [Candidatus Hydrogenedentota bacterium]